MREIPGETGNDGSRYHPGDLSTARKLLGRSGPATAAGYDRWLRPARGKGDAGMPPATSTSLTSANSVRETGEPHPRACRLRRSGAILAAPDKPTSRKTGAADPFGCPGRPAEPEDGRYTVRVPNSTPGELTVDGITLELVLQRKRVKNVNARLRGSTLLVSAPVGMPEEKLEPAVRGLARRLLRRAHAARVNGEEDALALARKVARRFPEPPSVGKALFVTTQRARWGSYSTKTKTVRLNAALRGMPGWVLEAVVAHELAHVFHPDHSPAFWELLGRACPEAGRAEAFLAGASWFARNIDVVPPVERELLFAEEPRRDARDA